MRYLEFWNWSSLFSKGLFLLAGCSGGAGGGGVVWGSVAVAVVGFGSWVDGGFRAAFGSSISSSK